MRKLTRRDFLKNSSAAVAGSLVFPYCSDDPVGTRRRSPPDIKKNLKIGIYGDPHAGYDGDTRQGFPPSEQIHIPIIDRFMEFEPDKAFVLGDLVHIGGTDQWTKFDNITSRLRDRGTEIYPVIGNHDANVGLDEYFNFFNSLPQNGKNGRYYYVRTEHPFPPALFIFLEYFSTSTSTACNEDTEQKNWLENVLLEHQDVMYRCAFFHVPSMTTGGRGPYPCASQFNSIFFEQGINLVGMGHIHAYERYLAKDHNGNDIHFIAGGGGGGFGCDDRGGAHCLNINPIPPGTSRQAEYQGYNYTIIEFTHDGTATGQVFTPDGNTQVDNFEISAPTLLL